MDPTLFDTMVIPSGVDLGQTIGSILLSCGEREVLYPNPDSFKTMLGIWSINHLRGFEKLVAAEAAQYNPIENYDRNEEWTDNNQSEGSSNGTGSGTDFVAPYNPAPMKESGATESQSSSSTTGSLNAIHSGRTHGNIGVTTSQQMLKEEIKISDFSAIQTYSEWVRDEFTLGLY